MAKKRGPIKGNKFQGTHRYPFGKALAEARIKRGLTQEKLAEKIGTSKRVISHFEREVKNPPAETLTKLSVALHIPVDALLVNNSATDVTKPETDIIIDRELNRRFLLAQKLPPAIRKDIKRYLDSIFKANGLI